MSAQPTVPSTVTPTATGRVVAVPTIKPIAVPVTISQSKRKRNKRLVLALSYTILVIAVLFAVYPVYFAFLVSLRPGQRLFTLDLAGMFLPMDGITLENYRAMIFDRPFPIWLGNSLQVALLTTISSVLLATSAAFAISRFKFWGRNGLLIMFLAIQSFPGVLALIPIVQILQSIGLYANLLGLVLAYSAGTLVFCTWNLKGYFDTIPVEIEESALIDGCSVLQSFFLILLPLSIPAVAITAFFGFLAGWSEYALASVLIPAPDKLQTLPVALEKIANGTSVPWGQFAAGSFLIAIPTMLAFMYMQRFLQSGLTAGGVKG